MSALSSKHSGNPRQLLRRMRDVMAARGTVEHRINEVVKLIAIEMRADLCSLYLLRTNQILELYATQSTTEGSPQSERIIVGEGLIGSIASSALPISIHNFHPFFLSSHQSANINNHYQSFMGVPILRDGEVIGVLVVQNKTNYHYTEDEVETLEIIATVFAELVAGGQLINLTPPESVILPLRLEGKRIISGIAIGHALLHQPRIDIKHLLAENPDYEIERLEKALRALHLTIDTYVAREDVKYKGDYQGVLENYRFIFQDKRWIEKIREAIYEGLTAEAAVYKVKNDTQARFKQVHDQHFREKLFEFEDLSNRLYYHLIGQENLGKRKIPPNCILFARAMASTELLDYDRNSLIGLVLEEASIHSHIAIVARSLDLPMISNVEQILNKVSDYDPVIIDANQGLVFIRPQEDIIEYYHEKCKEKQDYSNIIKGIDQKPSITKDNIPISLKINAGFQADLINLKEQGAEGVGLYRSEIPFMSRTKFPTTQEQCETYQKIFELIGDLPINFRTIDIGGDKILSYIKFQEYEENPAMGWRSLRITLDRPSILRQQLRALLEAGTQRTLHIMFPMVSEIAEFKRAKEILELELNKQTQRGKTTPKEIKLGVMLEVPSLIWQLPQILPHIDFISLGTNDLVQFLYASDRNSIYLGERYDPLSPGFLNCLHHIITICKKANVHISVCGEMAGKTLDALALIGLGITELSVSLSRLPELKRMIPTISTKIIYPYLQELIRSDVHSVREKLRHFAKDHDIIL